MAGVSARHHRHEIDEEVAKLLRMTSRERAERLGRLASEVGLTPAPGPQCEVDVLAPMLSATHAPSVERETIPRTLWARYFKAPLALVRLLQLFHPQFLVPSAAPLRILYLGAGREEVLDEGRWFTLAWSMLGLPRRPLAITAVGPALGEDAEPECSPWAPMVAGIEPVIECLSGHLGSTLATPEGAIDWESYFDIVVMHHPGFVANLQAWSRDPAWEDLAGFAQVPIVGTSFDAADFQFDRAGLALAGRIVDRVHWNPTAHLAPGSEVENLHGTRLQWGAVLWSTIMDPLAEEDKISPSQQGALDWIAAHHKPVLLTKTPLHRKHARWHYTCPMQLDDLHRWVYVTDDIRLDIKSGGVQAYGSRLEPTELTRKIVSKGKLEDRLVLYPALLEELDGRVDKTSIADPRG